MPDSVATWVSQILAGDRRAIARAISAIENGEAERSALLKLLFRSAGKAAVIGVTGSPGTGKSTLVEKMAVEYRRLGRKVGIIAVDPTSPFSGGAILGDRIRMQNLATDEGVYIRSMATRGQLGGLAPAAYDVVTVLDAAGCGVILIETVGVGQDEVDVARLADVTLVLLVPGLGDEVQAFKAGVMEIADVFVINKADRPGAERLEQELTALLSVAPRQDGWRPPVLKTVAATGEGIPAVLEAIDCFRTFGAGGCLAAERQREQWRWRLLAMLQQRLLERVFAERLTPDDVARYAAEVAARRRDPYSAVEEMMKEFTQR
jgi:LAO/AO transport system kinase